MAQRREWTAREDALLRQAGYKARLSDIALLISATPAAIRRYCKRRGIPLRSGRKAFLPPAALRRAWLALGEQQAPSPYLDLWEQAQGAGRLWLPGDDDALRELAGRRPPCPLPPDRRAGGVGRESLASILGRSAGAIHKRLRELGLNQPPQQYRSAQLARLLGVSSETVRQWILAGLLRAWQPGSWWFIHSEDAEWLLDREGGSGFRWADTDWQQLRRDCPLPEVKQYKAREKAA